MPTIVSKSELDEIKGLINEHIERTGESVTGLAKRAGVRRQFLSQLRSGNFDSTPHFENLKLVLKALGKKFIVVDD